MKRANIPSTTAAEIKYSVLQQTLGIQNSFKIQVNARASAMSQAKGVSHFENIWTRSERSVERNLCS